MDNKRAAIIIGLALCGLANVTGCSMTDMGKALATATPAQSGLPAVAAGSVLAAGAKGGLSPALIVTKYTTAQSKVLEANQKMAIALGLKKEADKVALARRNLTKGATKDAFESAYQTQTETSKAIEEKIAEKGLVLNADSKAKFSAALLDLGLSVTLYGSLAKDFSSFKPDLASMTDSATLTAIYIVPTLSSSVVSLGGTLKNAISFATDNGIPVPKEARAATAVL